ncbi:nuclear pore complex protein Nup205-like [Saccostrea cucullata]|uniref:nuclear pore complex protein Nup205-like n=1 Tax=Saccostrea cuccullata TaxID=36930 RepID=UPI002ED12062
MEEIKFLQCLPMMMDSTYIPDNNTRISCQREPAWTNSGVNGICEEDEVVINEALEANVFHFLRLAVVAVHDFHKEEYYLEKVQRLVTDVIFHMPLKVCERAAYKRFSENCGVPEFPRTSHVTQSRLPVLTETDFSNKPQHNIKLQSVDWEVLKILDDSVRQLETYKAIPGQESLESASLLCLQLIETSLEKSGTFLDACRETGASAMVSAMDRLLLSVNLHNGKADHLVNVTKFIQFSIPLPEHAQSAKMILYQVYHSAPLQVALVNLFTSNQTSHLELLHGFVECLEVEEPEQMVEKTIHLPEEEDDSREIGHVRNSTRQYLLQVLLRSLDQPSPNLAHLLLGFDIRKSQSRTLPQDPDLSTCSPVPVREGWGHTLPEGHSTTV